MRRKTWCRHDKRDIWAAIQAALANGMRKRDVATAVAAELNLTQQRIHQVWALFREVKVIVVAGSEPSAQNHRREGAA